MYLAVESNRINIVECLLDQKADINLQDDIEVISHTTAADYFELAGRCCPIHRRRNRGVGGRRAPPIFYPKVLLIFILAAQIAVYISSHACLVHLVAASTSLLLTRLVKSTSRLCWRRKQCISIF